MWNRPAWRWPSWPPGMADFLRAWPRSCVRLVPAGRGPGSRRPGPEHRGAGGRPVAGPGRAERGAQPPRRRGPRGAAAPAYGPHRARVLPMSCAPCPGSSSTGPSTCRRTTRRRTSIGRPRAALALADVLDAAAARCARGPGVTSLPGRRTDPRREAEPLTELYAAGTGPPLLLVDPHADAAAWQQHGALLAAVDRLRIEIEAAVRPPSRWRPPSLTDRPRQAVRRMFDARAARQEARTRRGKSRRTRPRRRRAGTTAPRDPAPLDQKCTRSALWGRRTADRGPERTRSALRERRERRRVGRRVDGLPLDITHY